MNTIMKQGLAKLKKVDLRDVWGHEALGFTRWLAEEENLTLLSDEIGLDIKLVQTEASVGRFSVDILAEESSSGRKIIIENQLEDTNHDHLGKIITYASGYDAEVIIWIVRDYREEHQKAIDWLNEHTDEHIGFFLIKVELWQIENSSPAPKFDIIVSPNEWAKAIKTSSVNAELTETKLKQLEFWNSFKNYVQEKDSKIRLQTPRPQHWYDVSLGSSDAHISLTVNSRENMVTADLYITSNKPLFDYLSSKKEIIEQSIEENVKWWSAKKASGIRTKKQVNDVFDKTQSTTYFEWLYRQTVLLQKVFGKLIVEFKKQI